MVLRRFKNYEVDRIPTIITIENKKTDNENIKVVTMNGVKLIFNEDGECAKLISKVLKYNSTEPAIINANYIADSKQEDEDLNKYMNL